MTHSQSARGRAPARARTPTTVAAVHPSAVLIAKRVLRGEAKVLTETVDLLLARMTRTMERQASSDPKRSWIEELVLLALVGADSLPGYGLPHDQMVDAADGVFRCRCHRCRCLRREVIEVLKRRVRR